MDGFSQVSVRLIQVVFSAMKMIGEFQELWLHALDVKTSHDESRYRGGPLVLVAMLSCFAPPPPGAGRAPAPSGAAAAAAAAIAVS